MPTVQLSSGSIHYLEQGQGVPLVLLAANPGDARDFEAVMPALARHYRVLALDWPGYGKSDIPEQPESWSALHYYSALCEFITMLNLPPALFIGNSVGGNAAARLAIESPERVRGLVLVAPGGFTPHNFVTRALCRLMGSRFALSPRLWASLYLRKRTPTVLAMIGRAGNEQSEPQRLALNRAIWSSFSEPRHDLRRTAGKISAPTLLLFGKQDPAIPAHKDGRIAMRCLPRAKFITMPCGHASYAELPEEFLAEVLPFLDACMTSEIAPAHSRLAA
jgi:pimeloyl-ACP methyl ester carboxylesterase